MPWKAHSWKPWVGRRLAPYSHLVEITLPRISKFLPSLPSNLLLHSCTNVRHSWKHLEGVGVLGEEMNPCLTTAWTHTSPKISQKNCSRIFKPNSIPTGLCIQVFLYLSAFWSRTCRQVALSMLVRIIIEVRHFSFPILSWQHSHAALQMYCSPCYSIPTVYNCGCYITWV